MKILLIDNYDSFTYNIVQRIGAIDPTIDLHIVRNDEVSVDDIAAMQVDRIILSPGPCTPAQAGVCNEVIPAFRGRIPILGICLGHQCIGAGHGMTVCRAERLMHGKTSLIHHDGRGIYEGLPNPFIATRYHSLIVERATVPLDQFEISAWTEPDDDDNEKQVVMGLRWKPTNGDASLQNRKPLDGVQFHPESFLTEYGPWLIANFLGLPRPRLAANDQPQEGDSAILSAPDK